MAASTIEQAIAYKLTNTVAVSTYTTNIFLGFIPETETSYPNICIFFINSSYTETVWDRIKYQISVRSKSYTGCIALAKEVYAALHNLSETVSGYDVQKIVYDDRRMIPEPLDVYHMPIDFIVLDKNT